ncbi:MAG: aldehyde dehydrogenase family protein [Chitinophagales bacterium]|nr:aldehyde dehydrogenase family protein [Chitinophagales bacterium]MDW8274620.1 aldehyde dehydrogenase family protein [Chitinophagales bacterium]
MQVVNPATEAVIATVEEDSKETIQQKFSTARKEQSQWTKVSLRERIKILQRFSSLLQERAEQLSKTLTAETGKPLWQSRNEIAGARNRIKWLTENAEKYLSDEIMQQSDSITEMISYEPLGVICNISAWNYPYLVGVNVFVPALLAGNAVIYKPSEYASLTGLEIDKLMIEAGVPREIFLTVLGGPAAGEQLLQLPFNGFFFTGSYKTGNYIYQQVSKYKVPIGLELGGKDPLYVADDVSDIAAVAASVADGAFYNNGQSCCAVERIYVHKNIYEPFIEAFVAEVKSWKVGMPEEDGVYITALTRKQQIEVLEKHVNDAIKKGARLLCGGKRLPRPGYFFEPTVLADATNDMLVMREESFGPIIGIGIVQDDEEAVIRMNDTDYGLTAAVYSSSEARAKNILAQIDAGTGYWNCCDRVSPALPWSGRKNSGIGSTLSHIGLRTFTRPKAYHLKKA